MFLLPSDWEPRSNVPEWKGGPTTKQKDNAIREMGMESQRSPSTSPERKQRQGSLPVTNNNSRMKPRAVVLSFLFFRCSQINGRDLQATGGQTSEQLLSNCCSDPDTVCDCGFFLVDQVSRAEFYEREREREIRMLARSRIETLSP
jgi:hypothetical protein